jgi:5-methylcytosine-specific restriction endonuclease McrA
MGAQPRYKTAPRKRTMSTEIIKTCPKCHRKIALSDAKFCCYCGADMRTEKDRLIERIRKGMELVSLLPSEARDEVQRLLIDVEKEIRKGE